MTLQLTGRPIKGSINDSLTSYTPHCGQESTAYPVGPECANSPTLLVIWGRCNESVIMRPSRINKTLQANSLHSSVQECSQAWHVYPLSTVPNPSGHLLFIFIFFYLFSFYSFGGVTSNMYSPGFSRHNCFTRIIYIFQSLLCTHFTFSGIYYACNTDFLWKNMLSPLLTSFWIW